MAKPSSKIWLQVRSTASSTYWTEQRTIRQSTSLRTFSAYSSLSSCDPLIRKTSVERPSPSDNLRAHLPVLTVPPNRVFQVVDLPEFRLPMTATNKRSAIALPDRTDALYPDRRVYDLSPSAVLFDADKQGEFGWEIASTTLTASSRTCPACQCASSADRWRSSETTRPNSTTIRVAPCNLYT